MDGLTNIRWQSDCDKPYEINLFKIVDLGNGKYEWQWGIANQPGTHNLARISFEIPSCVTFENPRWGYQNSRHDLQLTIVFSDDSYANCSRNPTSKNNLTSFLIPTRGTDITYFYLTLNTDKFAEVTAYFQDENGKCGSTCFPGIKDDCNTASCSFSQGRYFASPHKWPATTVTVGGKIYTEVEGRVLWNLKGQIASNSDARKAFFQAAAIKLSEVTSTASVWADVQIIDAWLATQLKLTAQSIATIPKNKVVAQAAGRIGDWIDQHHCKEGNNDKDEDDDDDDDDNDKKKKKRG